MAIDVHNVQWFGKARRQALPDTDPLATINKSGRITLNALALRKLGGEIPHALQLGFLPENSTVVLKAAEKGEKEAYRLQSQGSVYYVTSDKFLKRIGYHDDQPQRFSVDGDEDQGIIYFSLNEPIPTKAPQTDQPKRRGRPRKNPQ